MTQTGFARTALLSSLAAILCGCAASPTTQPHPNDFAADAAFLREHASIVELTDETGAGHVLIAPTLQCRVMTSTASGTASPGYGWINKELLASGVLHPHINAFGGEDRLWLGPEGGQFSIFFAPGSDFDLDHWQTPAPLDSEPFDVVSKDRSQVTCRREFKLTNYSGTEFSVRVDRQVRLVSQSDAWKDLKVDPPLGVKLVAYESVNRLTNIGQHRWRSRTGLLSIWILGQFNASPNAVVLVPYKQGPSEKLGKIVESGYFGQVPGNRLVAKGGVIYFRGDGQYRSKIGVSPSRAMPTLGSYDSEKKVLTLVQYTLDPARTDYVNSKWKVQDDPFSGDVANSYNDGPSATGASLGNFYELESSSPAAQLEPGKTAEHIHRTLHLTGDEAKLDRIAQAVLGAHLTEIPQVLPDLR